MNQKKDKIVQDRIQVIDVETAEIMSQEITQTVAVGQEPNYYKVYMQDLANLQNLNPTERQVLEVLSSNMSFENIIVIIKPIKERLSQITGKTFETVKASIQGLVKKGILIREERSCYRVNPKYIAKGKWQDIKALRLVIDYSEKGREVTVQSVTPHSITYSVKDGQNLEYTEENEPNQLDLFEEK